MILTEKAWFSFTKRYFKDLFPRFSDRTRINRTHRFLHEVIQNILKEIYLRIGYNEDSLRVIDSIPIPVCKFGRAHFHKTFKEYAAYGRCVSKKETYLGFKLHMLVAQDGFVTDFTLTPANIDDRVAIWVWLTYTIL